jgi:hypothetical protein
MIAALEVRVGELPRMGDAINVDLVNLSSPRLRPVLSRRPVAVSSRPIRTVVAAIDGIRSGSLSDQLDDAPDYPPGRDLKAWQE